MSAYRGQPAEALPGPWQRSPDGLTSTAGRQHLAEAGPSRVRTSKKAAPSWREQAKAPQHLEVLRAENIVLYRREMQTGIPFSPPLAYRGVGQHVPILRRAHPADSGRLRHSNAEPSGGTRFEHRYNHPGSRRVVEE